MSKGKCYESAEGALIITKTKKVKGEKEKVLMTIADMIKEGFSERTS